MQRAEGHHFRPDAWKCSNKPLQLLTYRNEAKRDHLRMKLYQLVGWPDLGAPFHRMAYRRMLHQMSQRPMSLRQLARHSGLERSAVQRFIDTLAERELLTEREPVALSFFGRCRSLLSAARHS